MMKILGIFFLSAFGLLNLSNLALCSSSHTDSKQFIESLECLLSDCDAWERGLEKESHHFYNTECITYPPNYPGNDKLIQAKLRFCTPLVYEYGPKKSEETSINEKNALAYLKHPDPCTKYASHIYEAYRTRVSKKSLQLIIPLKDLSACTTKQTLEDIRFKVLWRHNKDKDLEKLVNNISPSLKENYLVTMNKREKTPYISVDNALIDFGKNEEAKKFLCNANHPICNVQTSENKNKISYYTFAYYSLNNLEFKVPEGSSVPIVETRQLNNYPTFMSQLEGMENIAVSWPLRSFYTIKMPITKKTLELQFPKPFPLPEICTKILPSEMVYALIRQESLFNPQANSPAGAQGLLQVLFHLVPKNKNPYSVVDNLEIGCKELNRLYQKYKNPYLVAIAYNAGETFMRKNIPQSPKEGMDFIAYVESIPWTEPRNYVKSFMRNFNSYFLLSHNKVKFHNGCLSFKQANASEFLPNTP